LRWVRHLRNFTEKPALAYGNGNSGRRAAYCKKLIDVARKDGGYILDVGASLDSARPENVKTMFEFTREYGVY
jgi:hypothetical protein